MLKLLRANFHLLIKSKMFYIALAANAMMSVLAVLALKNYGENEFMFILLVMLPAICAAHTSLFVGKEYSDGTLRNKLIYGHTKGKVYFSYLITCVVANIILLVPCMAIVGVTYLDLFTLIDTKQLLLLISGYLIANAALCSLFVAIGFNISLKAVSAVIAVMIVFVGDISLMFLQDELSQPEVKYTYMDGNYPEITYFEDDEREPIITPNPDYIEEPTRTVLFIVYNFMPHGQMQEYFDCFEKVYHYWYGFEERMSELGRENEVAEIMKNYKVYVFGSYYFKESKEIKRDLEYVFLVNQLVLIGASTFFGLMLFKKKNLK